MKIAVIGTGVMGLSAALAALKASPSQLTVFTKSEAKSASRCAGGMLAPYSESDSLDHDLQTLAARYSIDYWRDLASKHDVYFKEGGTLVISHQQDMAYQDRFQTHLPQGTYEHVSGNPLRDLEPVLSKKFERALWVYDEAHLNTPNMLSAMKAEIEANADIRVDEDADPSEFDLVIDARGAYKIENNMRKIKGERILLRCPGLKLNHCLRMMHPRYPIYIVPQGDDQFVVGASMIEDNSDENFTLRSAMELMSAFSSLGGQVLESDIISMDTGFRPTFTDHRPRLIQQDNVITCNGLYRHGFLMAPILAKAVFDKSPEFDCLKERHDEAVH